jgi:hypothetical protein
MAETIVIPDDLIVAALRRIEVYWCWEDEYYSKLYLLRDKEVSYRELLSLREGEAIVYHGIIERWLTMPLDAVEAVFEMNSEYSEFSSRYEDLYRRKEGVYDLWECDVLFRAAKGFKIALCRYDDKKGFQVKEVNTFIIARSITE